MRRSRSLASAILSFGLLRQPALADSVVLVIGNSAYQNVVQLATRRTTRKPLPRR